MAYLIVRRPHKDAQRLPLSGPIILGRSLKCDIWLDDPALSREHCRLDPLGSKWILTDLVSRNGTRVGTASVQRHTLRDSDVIRIGTTKIEFRSAILRAVDPTAEQFHRLKTEQLLAQYPSAKRALPTPRPQQKTRAPATAASAETWTNRPFTLPFLRPRATPIIRLDILPTDPTQTAG